MSPMITNVSAINPPPPRPCKALVAISCSIFVEAPAKKEPSKNVTIANWKTIRRPYRSEIFPYNGVEAVEVNRYAVTTQV